jgi:hypothetical protein
MTREIAQELRFKELGTFASYYAATNWLSDNGYSYGSMCCGRSPNCGIMKGRHNIAKWYNLTKKEISQLDGYITSDDYREGEVKIIIFK